MNQKFTLAKPVWDVIAVDRLGAVYNNTINTQNSIVFTALYFVVYMYIHIVHTIYSVKTTFWVVIFFTIYPQP